MKCKICNEIYSIEKTFANFLKEKNIYICPKCYNKYQIKLGFFSLPLDNGHQIFIYTLFEKNYKISYIPFINELSMLYSYSIRNNKNALNFILDKFYIDRKTMYTYSIVSTLTDKDIIIITNYAQ